MNCRSFCSLLLPVLMACPVFGAIRVGTITASGPFTLSDAQVPQSATKSLQLVSGDKIDTTGSTAMILLADASRVILAPESKLKLERTSLETILLLEQGALSFKTAPSSRLVIRALGRSMRPKGDSEGAVSTRDPGTIARLAASSYFPAAQVTPVAPMLRLVILEGEGAINNIRSRTAREPIVEVQDENHRPVAGASVAFLLPGNGPGGGFGNGSRTINVLTDNQGRAVGRGLAPNNVPGSFEIAVSASYQGLTVNAVIHQTNVVAAALSTAVIVPAVIITAGGAAGTAFVLATSGETLPISPSQP